MRGVGGGGVPPSPRFGFCLPRRRRRPWTAAAVGTAQGTAGVFPKAMSRSSHPPLSQHPRVGPPCSVVRPRTPGPAWPAARATSAARAGPPPLARGPVASRAVRLASRPLASTARRPTPHPAGSAHPPTSGHPAPTLAAHPPAAGARQRGPTVHGTTKKNKGHSQPLPHPRTHRQPVALPPPSPVRPPLLLCRVAVQPPPATHDAHQLVTPSPGVPNDAVIVMAGHCTRARSADAGSRWTPTKLTPTTR